jgi:hypothetical protein
MSRGSSAKFVSATVVVLSSMLSAIDPAYVECKTPPGLR